MLPTRGELGGVLHGIERILRLDVAAFDGFDASLRGFWRSFWAAAILAPLVAAMVAHEMIVEPTDSPWRYAAFQLIGYAIGWLAFPLAMVRIARFLGREDRYFAYMVPYNWFHLVEILVWGPLLAIAVFGLLPPAAETVLSLAVLAVLLFYQWFIARRGLRVEGGTAAALVAIDTLLSLVIDRVSGALP